MTSSMRGLIQGSGVLVGTFRSCGLAWLLPTVLVSGVAFSCQAMAGEERAPGDEGKGTWTETKINWGYRGALALDRQTGNLFGAGWNRGLQMSSDLGKTFVRVDSNSVAGNPFSAHAVFVAADGGKLAVFSSQGGALSGHSLDGGRTWTTWAKVSGHGFDYGVVDWASGAIFVMPHEEYKAYFSADMGKTWTRMESLGYPGGANKPHQVGKFSYYQTGIGIFSAAELVYSQDPATGIQRSEDGGKTWAKVADHFCQGPVQILKGTGYWLAKKEENGKWSGILLATKDKGKTWQPVGKPIDNGESTYMMVPRFGKSEKHILAAAAGGIVESTDGGNTWQVAVNYAPAFKIIAGCVDTWDCFEYDPIHDVLYLFFVNEAYGSGKTWVYRR